MIWKIKKVSLEVSLINQLFVKDPFDVIDLHYNHNSVLFFNKLFEVGEGIEGKKDFAEVPIAIKN